ncbi:unnamed protein product [marine sediment metagenome]|uniref:DUF86 domain-containing protein n=1 Tax=marine sediment metagenome TaxID=412755 RepID=X1S2U9_9ZZZZ
MVNPEIINSRLREMEENLSLLEELKSTPFDKFSKDPKIFKLALYCLQICIQSLLDICHHIIVDNIFSCKKFDPVVAKRFTRQFFRAKSVKNRFLIR